MTIRLFFLLAAAVFLVGLGCGCASTSITKQSVNGDKWQVRSTRFLWQTERVKISITTNGLPEVEVNKTQTDAEALSNAAKILQAIASMK